jgi:hypothetical protein
MNPAENLTYDVFVNDPPPQDGLLPNGEPKPFSPMASTLIYGSQDAVLTDPGMTADQARVLDRRPVRAARPHRPGPPARLHQRRRQHRPGRLERAGYIRRRPASGDRRRLVVEVTEATAARDAEVFGGLIRQTSDLLATYTYDQLLVIEDFLSRIHELTAAYADALGS